MTSADVSRSAGERSDAQDRSETGDESASRGRLRQTLTPARIAGLSGGLAVLGGLRALRRGQRRRGLASALAGGLLLAVASRRRRSGGERSGPATDRGERDVSGPSSSVEGVDEAAERATGESDRGAAAGDDSEATAETGEEGGAADTESAGADAGTAEREAPDVEIDFESAADEPDERVGEGTYDPRAGVPVPERAFEDGFLTMAETVSWAIRERDGAVFLSAHRLVFEEGDEVVYVTDTEVTEEQLLTVPDVILEHWKGVDDVEPLDDADELVFATTDGLREGGVLWVVPEHRVEESLEE